MATLKNTLDSHGAIITCLTTIQAGRGAVAQFWQAITKDLADANKGARERTLDASDVADIIAKAWSAGQAGTESERFPGSYRGMPMATHCLAVRYGDQLGVMIWRGNAKTSARATMLPKITHGQWEKGRAAWTRVEMDALAEIMDSARMIKATVK